MAIAISPRLIVNTVADAVTVASVDVLSASDDAVLASELELKVVVDDALDESDDCVDAVDSLGVAVDDVPESVVDDVIDDVIDDLVDDVVGFVIV